MSSSSKDPTSDELNVNPDSEEVYEAELDRDFIPNGDVIPAESVLGNPVFDENPYAPIPQSLDTPNWLHPSSIIFEALSHGRKQLLPAGLALFGAAQGNMIWVGIALFAFLVSFLHTLFKYFTLRYVVYQGELIVTEGLFFKRVRTVPVGKIQNMDLVQNVIHRIFQVAEVKIETASGSTAEATLRVLSLMQIAELRGEIFQLNQPDAVGSKTDVADGTSDSPDLSLQPNAISSAALPFTGAAGITILEIPASWLIKAGMASNRGLLILGVIFGVLFQFDIIERIDFDAIQRMLPQDATVARTAILACVALLVIFVFLKVFGIVWYLLRFSGYRLARVGEDLRISCGLFTKVSATVPRRRIQFISIHRPFFLRLMGLASIKIETAGGAAKESEDASSTVARAWFVPVIPNEKVADVLAELRPGLNWDESTHQWKAPSPKTASRLSRKGILLSLLIAGVGLAISRPWGFVGGLVLLPLFIYFAHRQSRSMRYARTGFGVAYRSGIFYRKLSLTFFERFQTVRLDQGLFDRRWSMATLSVDTAAAGPAGHLIHVRMLDEKFALEEFYNLQKNAANNRPDWR